MASEQVQLPGQSYDASSSLRLSLSWVGSDTTQVAEEEEGFRKAVVAGLRVIICVFSLSSIIAVAKRCSFCRVFNYCVVLGIAR